jgi:hypothetical protein
VPVGEGENGRHSPVQGLVYGITNGLPDRSEMEPMLRSRQTRAALGGRGTVAPLERLNPNVPQTVSLWNDFVGLSQLLSIQHHSGRAASHNAVPPFPPNGVGNRAGHPPARLRFNLPFPCINQNSQPLL